MKWFYFDKFTFKLSQKIQTDTIYEEEGPRRAPKQISPSVSGESTPTAPGSRKTSQPAIKLDVIDESGGKSYIASVGTYFYQFKLRKASLRISLFKL